MSRSEVKIEGWVEVIVRDKSGRVKLYLGPGVPPEEAVKRPRELTRPGAGEHDCPLGPVPFSALPAKSIDVLYWRKNVITDVGLAALVKLAFAGLSEEKFGYLAIGTGTTSESTSDTALENEIARKAATVEQVTTSVEGDTAKLTATFSSADGLSGSSNVSEAGVFNAASGGTLLCRKTFTPVPVNWDAGDSITINYYVQFTR